MTHADTQIPHPAAGSAVRFRYFDRDGQVRIAVIISNVPAAEIKARAPEIRAALEAHIQSLGGMVLDISVDLEERERIISRHQRQPRPARGDGFLRLASAKGRPVVDEDLAPPVGILVRANNDSLWAETISRFIQQPYG